MRSLRSRAGLALVLLSTPGTSQQAAPFTRPGNLELLASVPSAQATVAATTMVSVLFDRAVDLGSVGARSFCVRGLTSGPAAGSYHFSAGGRRITFAPERAFLAGETVMVNLSHGLAGIDGRHLRPGGHSFQFRIAVVPSSGAFTDYDSLSIDSSPFRTEMNAVTAGDLDHDGYPDLLTTNPGTSDVRTLVNLADGSGGFTGVQVTSFLPDQPDFSALADLNGDAFLDVCGAYRTGGALRILLSTGTGTFLSTQTLGFPVVSGIAALDVDGDADLDLAACSLGTLQLVENDGFGGFTPTSAVDGGLTDEYLVAAGDMDSDGITDLVVTGLNSERIRTVAGDGQGSFTPVGLVSQLTGGATRDFELGDLDADGDLDVVLANATNGTAGVMRNLGDGFFSSVSILHPGASTQSSVLGDLDGDGDLDWGLSALVVTHSNFWRLYRNDGLGVFSFWTDVPAAENPAGIAVLDTDLDGDLDLALGDEELETIRLLRND